MARNLGRLHLVVNALGSEMMSRSESALTGQDMSDINFVYALLKGYERQGRLGRSNLSHISGLDRSADLQVLWTPTIVYSICEQRLGEIPVSIEMGGSFAEPVEGSSRVRLIQRDSGKLRGSHPKDNPTDDHSGRRPLFGSAYTQPLANPQSLLALTVRFDGCATS